MGMIRVRDTSEDVSGALKEALQLRAAGKLDRATEDMLGTVIYNIARWAVAEDNQMNLDDEDFLGEVTLHLLTKIDRLDLSRNGKAIIGYLKRAADNRIVSMHRYAGRKKRSAELVCFDDVTASTDIFGRINQT